MIAEYLRSLQGAVPLGIVSLIVSIALFAWILWRAIRLPAPAADAFARMPLETDGPESEQSHEVTR